ncbi:hypothetical protein VP01_834g3 [Puccinia sorghi]|uniref:Uncharacterized protein n=1 Tax=Puccinia sorghi TaxID=27349 RepID=A0A0L6U9Q0_9BASI|nr:hypothetical protein VP01_834g3 [Puccinia sorghi]
MASVKWLTTDRFFTAFLPLLPSRVFRLGILVATWFLFHQTYIDLSPRSISSRFCSLLENFVLRPLHLQPMEDFCDTSLKWSIGILALTAAAYVFRCTTWTCVEDELRLSNLQSPTTVVRLADLSDTKIRQVVTRWSALSDLYSGKAVRPCGPRTHQATLPDGKGIWLSKAHKEMFKDEGKYISDLLQR